MKIELANTDRIDEYDALCIEFMDKILNIKEFLVTDESDLHDFIAKDEENDIWDLIKTHFKIEKVWCKSTRLVDIFEVIQLRRNVQ